MNEQWQELKETITEMRDNNGTGTQQEVCKFLANLMDVLEKQMQEPKTGHWIEVDNGYICSECDIIRAKGTTGKYNYCPNCGAKMVEPQESETWNGYHGQITAPKGTFERIFNDADDEDDI